MSASTIRPRYDVVIAGARVAGAPTAMLLARAGLRVLVVDPLPRGRDTLSTHALMRGGVMQLQRWGLLDVVRAAGTPVARTTSFHYLSERIDIPIKPKDGIDGLYAPRRTVLDPILADAAEQAGADVVHGVAVSDVFRDREGRVRGVTLVGSGRTPVTVRADLVIGADGLRSKVARLVGARVLRSMEHSAAAIYGHWPALGIEGYHWHFGPGLAAGAIPTNDGETCIFVSLPPDLFRTISHADIRALYRRSIRDLSPELDAALTEVKDDVKLRAFPGVPGFVRQSIGRGWALVGDAAYFRDPLTAHGITDALREAEFLVRAIVSSDPGAMASYEQERSGRVTGVLESTDRICSFDWTMDEIKELHLTLSKAMNVPVQAVRALDSLPSPEAPVTAAA